MPHTWSFSPPTGGRSRYRSAMAAGLTTHTPYHFHQVTRLATEDIGYRKLMAQTGPMDRNGYLNLGLFANYLDVVDRLDEIYVEVNEKQPVVHGPNWLHISQVTRVVENHHPVFALPPEPVRPAVITVPLRFPRPYGYHPRPARKRPSSPSPL
ncbi:MAG: hypothetical protein QME84_12200 [Actinomycetota bacterium]|nr:hypothetical protein [Actinomycetota bacterium]